MSVFYPPYDGIETLECPKCQSVGARVVRTHSPRMVKLACARCGEAILTLDPTRGNPHGTPCGHDVAQPDDSPEADPLRPWTLWPDGHMTRAGKDGDLESAYMLGGYEVLSAIRSDGK